MNSKKELTFELNKDNDCLEIHGNVEGLKFLSEKIIKIINDNLSNDHLMTENWGGNELSSEKNREKNILINHVKIFNWNNTD